MSDKLDYIAIDFETANRYKNSACSVGLVRFIDGQEADSCYSLIRPPKMYFVPEWIEEIHHISYKDVRDKPFFSEIWDTMVMPFIHKTPELPLVAHNGKKFDMQVIRSCCDYFGMAVPLLPYVDSLFVAQKTWREFNNHRLAYLAENFNIKYNAHHALDDSRTCGKIIKLAAEKWQVSSINELLLKCNLPMEQL